VKGPLVYLSVAGVLVAAAIAVVATALASPGATHDVAIGQPIRQDDFTYTVLGFSRSQDVGLGRDRVRAKGVFYVVTIEVDNQAKVVSFRWDPSIAAIVDAHGRRYEFSVDAQRVLDAGSGEGQVVAAGDARKFLVAFDVPSTIVRPALSLSNGILMGDVFDLAAYARARVPLE